MATGPWSVKGIDPQAREAAKAAAQREGLTLGEWMNQRLLGEAAAMPSRSHTQPYERARFTAPGSLSILSNNTNHQDVYDAIEDLTARLEAAERRSTLAITGIDQSVLGMLTRLEGVEKVHGNIASKLDDSLSNLDNLATKSRDELDRMVSKVDRATEDSARRIDTVAEHTELQLGRARHELAKELELVNSHSDDLTQRLGAAERMTDNAVRTLEASFASVDDRLRQSEKKINENGSEALSDMFSRRFKSLSEELIHVVAQTRGQLASQIETQSAAPRLEQFETSLREVRGSITKTERRHADTLERIAGEVGKLGSAIEHRFSETERNTAIGLDKMLDGRFREFQNDHAVAIDKIGDGLTGAITRLEEKLNNVEMQRNAEDNLETRMAAAEERTAKMIEDAMGRIQDQLNMQAAPDQDTEDSPVQKAMTALATRLETLENQAVDVPFFDPTLPTDGVSPPPLAGSPAGPNPALEEVIRPPHVFANEAPVSLPPLPQENEEEAVSDFGSFDGEPFADAVQLEPENMPEAVIAPVYSADEEQFSPAGATADASFMAAARRTVRAPGVAHSQGAVPGNGQSYSHGGPATPSGGARKLLMAASFFAIIAIVGAGGMTYLDFGNGDKNISAGVSNTANADWDTLVDGTAETAEGTQIATLPLPIDNGLQNPDNIATLDGAAPISASESSTKAVLVQKTKPDPAPKYAPVKTASRPPARSSQTASSEPVVPPLAQPSIPVNAVPLAQAQSKPASKSTTGRLTVQQAATNGDPVAQFQLASAKIDAGDTQEGIALMRQAANRGLPIAQYRLGKVYEDGTGVTRDADEGRRWTERAANGGNRRAMHNLAMLYAEGNSVTQSYETAAKWFQEAARMGLTNSQYNLAFLYEQGLGVPESLAEAFAWYSIAGKAGDEGARERAGEIRATLSVKAKSEANTIIADFTPRPLDLAANGIFRNVSWARPQLNTAPNIARTQILLARLGYQPGPADGNLGGATKRAVIAYERDNGLAQTGRIDATLLAKLEAAAVN